VVASDAYETYTATHVRGKDILSPSVTFLCAFGLASGESYSRLVSLPLNAAVATDVSPEMVDVHPVR
jgi:hypothetical protein